MHNGKETKGFDQVLLHKLQILSGDRRSSDGRALVVRDLLNARSALIEKITEIADRRASAAVAAVATDRTSPTGRALLASIAAAAAADKAASGAGSTLDGLFRNASEQSSLLGEFAGPGAISGGYTPWTEANFVEFGPVTENDLWLTSGSIEQRDTTEAFFSSGLTRYALYQPQSRLTISIQKQMGDPWSAPISVIDFTGVSNPPWSIYRVTDTFTGVAYRVRYATSRRLSLIAYPDDPPFDANDTPPQTTNFRDSVLIAKLLRH